MKIETPHAGVLDTALNADKRQARTSVSVTHEKDMLVLKATSQGASPMRSIINTYVRLIDASIKSLEVKTWKKKM